MSLHLGRTVFGSEQNRGNLLSRNEAEALFNDWVLKPGLKLHMKQVAYLMACFAREQLQLDNQQQWAWEMAGLLHDADWDQWPQQHCKKIIEELEKKHIDPGVIHAIASHGPNYFGVEPISQMDKMLYAFDELSGLIHAYALMRPGGYDGMEVKGVKKRLKEKAFAASVSRAEITEACDIAKIDIDDLIAFIIPRQQVVV